MDKEQNTNANKKIKHVRLLMGNITAEENRALQKIRVNSGRPLTHFFGPKIREVIQENKHLVY